MTAFTVSQEVNVDVDVDVGLDDITENLHRFSDDELRDLRREIGARLYHRSFPQAKDEGEPWTIKGCVHDVRQAYYARDASRLETVLRGLDDLARALDES
jgi:hypothetical protein